MIERRQRAVGRGGHEQRIQSRDASDVIVRSGQTPRRPTMDMQRAVWIKDPLAILASAAERGIVVQGDRIVELVPAGGTPATADCSVLEAGAHVVLPGLINKHHPFYPKFTPAYSAGRDLEAFSL